MARTETLCLLFVLFLFFFNDTATTEIYTLSLHDALPISTRRRFGRSTTSRPTRYSGCTSRSEEHTSELQSRPHLVCRLLLEKKKSDTYLDSPVIISNCQTVFDLCYL